MSAQTISPGLPAEVRKLVDERVRVGRLYFEAFVHGRQGSLPGQRLWWRMAELDRLLETLGADPEIYLTEIVPGEAEADHLPWDGSPAARSCGWCRRAALGLDAEIVLPPYGAVPPVPQQRQAC